jgi:hypothetical protein
VDQVVADYTLYGAPSEPDAIWTWMPSGRGRPVDVDVPWTWTARGRGRPKKTADVGMPRTQTRHGRGLATDAGVSSMGFFFSADSPCLFLYCDIELYSMHNISHYVTLYHTMVS